MEQLFNHLDICSLIYQGNTAGARSLFESTFSQYTHGKCISQIKMFLYSLNYGIYNYILIHEKISLHQCCNETYILISNCYNIEELYQMGLHIIDNYSRCQDYLIEKYSNPHIKKALYYIHQHLGEDLTLENVCQHIGINKCYFCTLFKTETGYTYSKYINKARIRLAHRLIKTTSLALDVIASQCGFNNYSYFCTTFKNLIGSPPTQLRNL